MSQNKSFARPALIESLEGRQLLSATVPGIQAATADAGGTPDTAVDLGTISKKKTISKQQSIGKADTTDVFKFTTTKTMDVQLKLSGNSAKPKLIVENSAFEDAFSGAKSSSKLRVGEGTYYVTVTSSSAKSGKYKLEVKANPTSKAPKFEDTRLGGTFSGTVTPIKLADPNADITKAIHQYTFTATQTGTFQLPVTFAGEQSTTWQCTPVDAATDPEAGGGGGSGLDLVNGTGTLTIKTKAGLKYYLNIIAGQNETFTGVPTNYTVTFDPSFKNVDKQND